MSLRSRTKRKAGRRHRRSYPFGSFSFSSSVGVGSHIRSITNPALARGSVKSRSGPITVVTGAKQARIARCEHWRCRRHRVERRASPWPSPIKPAPKNTGPKQATQLQPAGRATRTGAATAAADLLRISVRSHAGTMKKDSLSARAFARPVGFAHLRHARDVR
jgi:hypothetical protein